MKVNKIPEQLKLVRTSQIKPLHKPDIGSLLNKLVGNFKKDGWDGRPLLVVKTKNGKYRALTGSHRYAAAKKVGFGRIPCMVVDDLRIRKIVWQWDRHSHFSYYKTIARKLKAMGFHMAGILLEKDYMT